MPPRIVVVDDDLAILSLMHDALAPEGYRVACASSFDAGLRAARRERPDLLILDLRLGTPDAGWRLVETLRADARTAAIPIIACSADHRALHARLAWLRERNCATLAKPFDLDELLERVAAAVPAAPPPIDAARCLRRGGASGRDRQRWPSSATAEATALRPLSRRAWGSDATEPCPGRGVDPG